MLAAWAPAPIQAGPGADAAVDDTAVDDAAATATATPAPTDAVTVEADAPRKKRRTKRRTKRSAVWRVDVEAGALAMAGALQGEAHRPGTAAVMQAEADARVDVTRGQWRLRVPIEASHRETQGASFDETGAAAGAALRWRHSARLRITAEGELSGVWRPDWPDPYQPAPTGGTMTTDRYSHLDRSVGATVALIPIKHHHARVAYEYTLVDYRQDPAFDAIEEPNHLVPSDHEQHALDLSWRYFGSGWKAGVGADLFVKQYFFAFARDAGTGYTHAGPGGAPPNPLQRLRGLEPSASVERTWLDDSLEIDLSYGYEIQQDTFEGYYSYRGHHPVAKLRWTVRRGHELSARAELRWRTYGPNAYAAGPSHPPLTYGDRRVDRRGVVSTGYRMNLGGGWSAVADGSITRRRTNFPSYEPGVFPASRAYDIDWNYDNWALLLGVEGRR